MTATVTALRAAINNRRIINGSEDIVQLHPVKHVFALEAYRTGNANHWLPQKIPMQKDVEQWRSSLLTEDDRRVVKMSLGFFATGDSIVANNLVLSIYRHVTSPECRLYLLRQAYEEAIHTESYQYMIESLGLDADEIFTMLMGEKVGQRKDFIKAEARKVQNLDI